MNVTVLAASLLLLVAHAHAAGPGDWVSFESPPFTDPGLPHGGPDWSLTAPRLPALSPTGGEVLVAKTEVVPGGAPNLTLSVLHVSDGAVLSSHVLLTPDEFAAARATTPQRELAASASAFAELAKRVRGRIAQANKALAGKGFQPMTACHIEDPADSAQPVCSMERQRIDCSGAAMRYGGGTLSGTWNKRPFRLGGRDFSPAPVRDTSVGEVPVRACFGGVWFDSMRGVLVGYLLNECQLGGDWCIVQPKWLTFRLRGRETSIRP